ncbi:MAG: ImmA/IrrE family metallo-endopeptidase [Terracidiphilus sp.]|jgi:Zn-dependent peptidase ImmA (M78 family)
MKNVRSEPKRKNDPDVQALIDAGGGLQDPRSLVLSQARKLVALYTRFESSGVEPRERLMHLASLNGLTVESMSIERRGVERRDALIFFDPTSKRGTIFYNPDRSEGRVNFSIAHEIAHTFFPSTSGGVRFREMCESDSREANQLERLCDAGAAELLMPKEQFQKCVGQHWTMEALPRLTEHFGSSVEATAFRLASAHPGIAAAGSLRFRRTKGDQAKAEAAEEAEQKRLFPISSACADLNIASPKYRRQSFHASEGSPGFHTVPWNKSFDEESAAYGPVPDDAIAAYETLPNGADEIGMIEFMRAPFQRDEASLLRPDLLFFWRRV